ncbi:hypothetical protein [Actinoallomurus liliacearum]
MTCRTLGGVGVGGGSRGTALLRTWASNTYHACGNGDRTYWVGYQ